MHVQHCHATVDDLHAVKRCDIGNRSAATDVDLAKLCRLESYIVLIHHRAYCCQILCICIVTSALAACSSIFIKYEPTSEIRTVLLLKAGCKQWIICCADIR